VGGLLLLLVLLFSSVGDIEDLDILKVLLFETRKREEGRGGRECPDEENNNE
jgi:hypothetical protein